MSFKLSFKRLLAGAASSAVMLAFAACNDVTKPGTDNEREVFTTVRLTYTDTANPANVAVATFKDPDGEGGGGPTVRDTLRLQAGKTYAVRLELLDESNPADVEDMAAEVTEEGVDHQVFYTVAGANLTVAYADHDAKNRPLGLRTLQTAGAAGEGALTVTLKHQPGLKGDHSTIATGETDVEVVFQVVIQ